MGANAEMLDLDTSGLTKKAKAVNQRTQLIHKDIEVMEAKMEPYLKELEALRAEMIEEYGTDDPEEIKRMFEAKKSALKLEIEEAEKQCDEAEKGLEKLNRVLRDLG